MNMHRYRALFLGVLVLWVAMPLLRHDPAQDAIPLAVAGSMVAHHPAEVYVAGDAKTSHDLQPHFHTEACTFYPTRQDCLTESVPFVSSPLAIPIVAPLAWAGHHAELVVRLLGALLLAGAMLLLWKRWNPTDEAEERALLLTAVAATPMVALTLGQGQTTPLLFLAAMLPITWLQRRSTIVPSAGVIASAIAFKVFPAIGLAVLAYQRKWRLFFWVSGALGALGVLFLYLGGAPWIHEFVAASKVVSRGATALGNNGSINTALYKLGLSSSTADALAWVVRVAIAVPLIRAFRRTTNRDAQWAFAWLAVLLFFPQVWPHYLLLVIPAISGALLAQGAAHRKAWMLPAFTAAASLAGSGFWHQSAGLQLAVLAGATIGAARLMTAPPALAANADDEATEARASGPTASISV